MKQNLIDRITEYLSMGGLFNPELMDKEEVNKLLIDVRDYLLSNGVMDMEVVPTKPWDNRCSVCSAIGHCIHANCPSKVT